MQVSGRKRREGGGRGGKGEEEAERRRKQNCDTLTMWLPEHLWCAMSEM